MSQALRLHLLTKGVKEEDLVLIRSGYDGQNATHESPLVCEDTSLTRQSEKEGCDINILLKRYAKNEDLAVFQHAKQGKYGDFTTLPNYEQTMNAMAAATAFHESLPEEVRGLFDNTADLLEFLADPDNNDIAVELGLRRKDQEAAPTAPTPPAPPAPPNGSGTPPAA